MGFGISNRVTVTDFDRCEVHNLGTQWFRTSHVLLGEAKVDALGEMLAWLCEREIVGVCERFRGDEDRRVGPVVVLAVDSLDERRRIWARLKQRKDVRFLLDARMGAEILEIHALDITRDDPDAYERSLEADGDGGFSEPCTRRAILYTVLGGAAFVGSVLRAYVRGDAYPRHVVFDFRHFLIETGFDHSADPGRRTALRVRRPRARRHGSSP
jgi:hypothetical protein